MEASSAEARSRGRVVRVLGDSLAYVWIEKGGKTLTFQPNAVDHYRGESFQERKIREGSIVDVAWKVRSDIVTGVTVVSTPSVRSKQPVQNVAPTRSDRSSTQRELHPEAQAVEEIAAFRALPKATRQFGKLIGTAALAPGDLMLTREMSPDRIAKLISTVQVEGGYHPDDAKWTHAAMYVGDAAHIVEATFARVPAGDVRLTNLDEYSKGLHALRFRRSRFLNGERDGWRLCVRALSRLKTRYDFLLAARMWFRVVIQGTGFYDDRRRIPVSRAVVCSTLYSDSYNEATGRSLGEVCGACVPAWLSTSDEFEDIDVNWLRIR